MKVTIDINKLSDNARTAIGEVLDAYGRSGALREAIERIVASRDSALETLELRTESYREELSELGSRLRDREVALTQERGEAECLRKVKARLDKRLGEVVCERDQALTDLHWAKDELDELRHLRRNFEDMSIRLERELNEARAQHQKALEQNMRFEAELVVLASEKTHACSEWRRAVAEEAYLRGEYDKLKEKLTSTSST